MEVRGQFSGVISFFHHRGPKTKIQITRLSSKYLNLLNLYFLPHFLLCLLLLLLLFLRPGLPTQPRYVLSHSASSHSILLDFLTLPRHLHPMFLSLCQILEQATAAFGPFFT